MINIILYIFFISVSFISCVSSPVNNYSSGSYNTETSNVRIFSGGLSAIESVPNIIITKTETEVIFTFNGPQGVHARLYYNGELIGAIEPEKTIKKSIPNNEHNFLLKAQIGDETSEFRLAARGSTIINVNITARRTPSGIVISDFNVVNRAPLYKVRYVSTDSLDVRDKLNDNAVVLYIIPRDCRVEILEEYTNGWVRIKYYDDKFGFVDGTRLTSTQPPQQPVLADAAARAREYSNNGFAYRNKEMYDRAIEDYTAALRINPNDALAYNKRGFAYRNKGMYDRAIEDYTAALRINPNDARAYNNRGVAYYHKEMYDRAIEDYTTALRIDPNYALAKSNIELARKARGY